LNAKCITENLLIFLGKDKSAFQIHDLLSIQYYDVIPAGFAIDLLKQKEESY